MTKRIQTLSTILICIVYLTIAFAVDAIADSKLVDLVKKAHPGIVKIETYDLNNKPIAQGSGFFVNNAEFIVTNYHVIKGAHSVKIITTTGEECSVVSIVSLNREADIVKLSTENTLNRFHSLTLSPEVPQVGEDIFVIGNPLGLDSTVSNGIVSAVREVPKAGKMIQISAPISEGSSGSPVMNESGQVIGVASGCREDGQSLNFAVPGFVVIELENNKFSPSVPLAQYSTSQPKSHEADDLYDKGVIYAWKGQTKLAIEIFKKVVKLDPKSADAYYNLGVLSGQLKEYTQAIFFYQKSIELKPNYYPAYYNLGISLGIEGYHQKAKEILEKSISLENVNLGAAYFALGNEYHFLGMESESLNAFRLATQYNPTNVTAFFACGLQQFILKDYNNAIASFSRVIAMQPDHALAYHGLGKIYYILKDYNSAIFNLKQATILKPDLADSYYLLSQCYSELNYKDMEYEMLKKTIQCDPSHVLAHVSLGIYHVLNDDTDAALREYQILKPLDQEAAERLFNIIY